MAHLLEVDWRELWGDSSNVEGHGAIFTKEKVVEFILDLAGYVPSNRLLESRLLEPSCGDGAFLTSAVKRLIASELDHKGSFDWESPLVQRAFRATDINEISLKKAIRSVSAILKAAGCPDSFAQRITDNWFLHTDFLLEPWRESFDFVIGNPPYVRIEDLPRNLISRYRHLYSTTTDRADLYVAFIERGLELLSPNGILAFICANRFAKNKYGASLRRLIAEKYHVRFYINLEHSHPFLDQVSAYPAIFVIDQRRGQATRAVTVHGDIEPEIDALTKDLTAEQARKFGHFESWYENGSPWVSTSPARLFELREIERKFPTLEDSAEGTRIGIGVATGADKVFVSKSKVPGIEEDRQIPLLMAGDVQNEIISWSGHFVLNPFSGDGSLVDLDEYPGLAAHLNEHSEKLIRRHVARNKSRNWYRTIDRIWPEWTTASKLVLPDIRETAIVGIDEGNYYPHHNLYWIMSESWPLFALKALLRSSIIHEQVEAYSVQMRGGALRFQAQTLRRLRIPPLSLMRDSELQDLASVSCESDLGQIDSVVESIYRRL